MAIVFNGVTITQPYFDGIPPDIVKFNGTTVWPDMPYLLENAPSVQRIGVYVASAHSDTPTNLSFYDYGNRGIAVSNPVNNAFSITASYTMPVSYENYIVMCIRINTITSLLSFLNIPTNYRLELQDITYSSNKGTFNSSSFPTGMITNGQTLYVNYNNHKSQPSFSGTMTLSLRAIP